MSKSLRIYNNSITNLSAAQITLIDQHANESCLDFDLECYPWSFKDNFFDKIEIHHLIECVVCFKSLMEEFYRTLKLDGELRITSYYFNSIKQHILVNQKRQISEYSFLPFNQNWRKENKISDQINCNFEFTYGYDVEQEWSLRSDDAKNFAIKHYNNVPEKLVITLIKKN